MSPTHRQIRATFDAETITVYQAFGRSIADPALRAGRLVEPFARGRMTWIKPSQLWMAYRSGWATKPGQERVLAIRVLRTGFEWALGHSCLSHFEPRIHRDRAEWSSALAVAPVRIQWDPERDLWHRPLDHRSLQIGLSGEAVERYLDEWIVGIDDATPRFHAIGELLAVDDVDGARRHLLAEQPYSLDVDLAEAIDADPPQ